MQYDLLSNAVITSRKRHVQIDRPIYTETDVNKICMPKVTDDAPKPFSLNRTFKQAKDNCSFINIAKWLMSFFPVLTWLPKYKVKECIVKDLSCGLTLGIIQIPQGMAYAMLTTLPAIYGLYASLIPVLVYFLMGTSRHLSLGTFAIICLMVGELVQTQVDPILAAKQGTNVTVTQEMDTELRLKYAVTASFLVGIMQVGLGMLRVGFITMFLSDPLISGFTTGAAFHIFSSQVRHLVGMTIPNKHNSGLFKLFKLYIYIFGHITEGHYGAFIVGVVAIVILLVTKHFAQKYSEKLKFPVPAEIIVVILGTGLSYGCNFNSEFGIPILSSVPKGMPPMSSPTFSIMGDIVVNCAVIAIVAFVINISVAKAFAKKNNYTIDPNQELYAYGVLNIIGSFFSCFVAAVSLSRSVIQSNLGCTQIAGIISSILIVLTLVVLAPLFEYLPKAILAAIVLVALKGLFRQFTVLKALWKISKVDYFVWISNFIAVFCLGVDLGLAVGVAVNILAIIIRTSRPSSSLLGRVKDTELYISTSQHQLDDLPGVKIFQFHSALYYANVEYFQTCLYKSTVNPNNGVRVHVPQSLSSINQNKIDPDGVTLYISEDGYVPPKVTDDSTVSENSVYRRSENSTSEKDDPCPNIKQRRDPLCHTSVSEQDEHFDCPLHTVILDCSQISFADSMGIGTLLSVCSEFKSVDVDVYLCNCTANFLDMLNRGGFIELHGTNNIFVSTHDAVQHAFSIDHLTGIYNADTYVSGIVKAGNGSRKELKQLSSSLDAEMA